MQTKRTPRQRASPPAGGRSPPHEQVRQGEAVGADGPQIRDVGGRRSQRRLVACGGQQHGVAPLAAIAPYLLQKVGAHVGRALPQAGHLA